MAEQEWEEVVWGCGLPIILQRLDGFRKDKTDEGPRADRINFPAIFTKNSCIC